MAQRITRKFLNRQIELARMYGADIDVEGAFGGVRLCNSKETESYSPYQSPTKTLAALNIFMHGFKAPSTATQTVRFVEGPHNAFVCDIEVPARLSKHDAIELAAMKFYIGTYGQDQREFPPIKSMNWYIRGETFALYPKHNPTSTRISAQTPKAMPMDKCEGISEYAPKEPNP